LSLDLDWFAVQVVGLVFPLAHRIGRGAGKMLSPFNTLRFEICPSLLIVASSCTAPCMRICIA
jgi:hypothetical protein